MTKKVLTLILLLTSINSYSQRNMENLGRGLVAVRKSNNLVFISWRIPANEYRDSAVYNLYRNDILIDSNIVVSNYTDPISTNENYSVSAIIKGIEHKKSAPEEVITHMHSGNKNRSIHIPIKTIDGYDVAGLWVGDLTGDREYDFVLVRRNGESDSPVFVEAYSRHGDFLWRINCGPNSYNKNNITPGSSALMIGHGDGITVHDINNDGLAEVILRTSNGVTFGDGKVLVNRDNNKQFISVLEGTTGKELGRDSVPTDFIRWGQMNGHMGIAYLDGIHPYVVWSSKNRRGDGGFNMLVTTYKWQNDSLQFNWKFARDRSIEGNYPDGHNIRIIDVDGDGKDEITPFGYTLDDDGQVLYTLGDQGVVHGDRFFIGDMDPIHEGLEGYGIQQSNPNGLIWYYYDAKTGQFIHNQYENPIIRNDYARGFVGDMDPRSDYFEFFTFTDGLYNINGERITTSKPDSYPNLRIWWDGDVLSENLDNFKMTKWDYIADIDDYEKRLFTFSGLHQDYRKTPAFYGDILGDWREEVVYISDSESSIEIFTTTYPTNTRIYSLAQNPGYRNCFNVKGYYQGHMTDFYIGTGMTPPLAPEINILNKGQDHIIPNGMYFIKSVHSDLFLDTIGGISQQPGSNAVNQIWQIKRNQGLYEIYSPKLKKYLGYADKNEGTCLALANNPSLFSIEDAGYNTFYIVSPTNSTLQVSIKDKSMNEGENLEWKTNSDQQFEFYITNDSLDCNGDWKGTAFYDNCGSCYGGNTQIGECTSIDEGLYKIKSSQSGFCLQKSEGNIIQVSCSETDAQVWDVMENETGGYVIINFESGEFIDLQSQNVGNEITMNESGCPLRLEAHSENDYFIKLLSEPSLGIKVADNSTGENTKMMLEETNTSSENFFEFEPYTVDINKEVVYFNAEIFPNPANDHVILKIPGGYINKCTLHLYNNVGQLKYSENISKELTKINIETFASGIYHVKIVSAKQIRDLKIIKL